MAKMMRAPSRRWQRETATYWYEDKSVGRSAEKREWRREVTENLTQRQLHEAHCGPARGNFKVCYCNQPCCKTKDAHGNLRCICHHGCRAEAACQSRTTEIAVSIGVDTCTCPWNEKEAPTWTDSAASPST